MWRLRMSRVCLRQTSGDHGHQSAKGDMHAQVDLPAAVGVDLVHCERQADLAIKSSNGSLQRIQGDLITLSYFDSLAVEVNETLKARIPSRISNPTGALILQPTHD